jgi:cytochrome c
MMKTCYLIAIIAALSVPAAAFAADDGEALFNKAKCTTCHKPDSKAVGPNMKDLSAKYAGNNDAQAALEKKVRTGGSGVWGAIKMPPTPAAISDGDIHTIVAWMLSHK